jgi:hypothetical protein
MVASNCGSPPLAALWQLAPGANANSGTVILQPNQRRCQRKLRLRR